MAKLPAFEIREATLRDVAGILGCPREAFEPFRQAYTPEAFADTILTAPSLNCRFATMTLLVAATADGAIVGTIGFSQVDAREGHLRGMAVRAAWQGTEVARQLLAAAEAGLQGHGCRRVTLDTTQPLERAIAFYQKHGCTATGHLQHYFGMRLYEFARDLAHG